MADEIVIQPIWDDSKFKGGVMSSTEVVEKMTDEVDELQKVTTAANKKMATAASGTTKKLDDQMIALKGAKNEGLSYSKGLEQIADNINVMGVNLGGTIRSLKAKQAALKATVTGLGAGVKGLKLFKVALASTGVGLLVVALGSLVAWFTKTQEGIDKVNRVLGGLSAAFSVVVDRASKVGGALVGLLSGTKSLSEAWNESKGALSGLGTEMTKEATQAAALTGQLQDLKRAEDELNIKRAESRAEIKRLNQIAEDTTKSTKERAEAAKAAIAIETELADERKTLLEQQLAAQKALDDQGNSTDADLAEQRRLRSEIANQAAESLELQTTLTNKLNTIEDQRRAKMAEEAAVVAGIADQYRELLDTILEENESFDDAALTPVQRLQNEIKEATSLLAIQRQEFIKLGEAAGLAPDKIAEGLAAFDEYELNLKARLDFANSRDGENSVEALEKQILDPFGGEINLSPSIAISPEIETSGLDVFRQKLASAFSFSPEESAQIKDSLESTFSSVLEIYSASIQSRIAVLDEEIEQRRENRENLQEELEIQEELESQGLANSAEYKREAIALELEEENKAIEERDKLRKKEQKLQAITQLATQVTSLITAGAQIFAAEGSKGAVGVAFAIAAIASMIASFAKLKADAKKQTSKLYVGSSDLSEHLTFVGPKSDRNSPGYSVVDAQTGMPTGVIIGGDEALMKSSVSKDHRGLFKDMNMNPQDYKGIDMVAMVKGRKDAISSVVVATKEERAQYGYVPYTDKKGNPCYIEFMNGRKIGRYTVEI